MWFDTWQGVWRVVAVGVPAYAVLVVVLRVSGKRTLAKMNAFDLVVTVALGSTLASIITSKGVALAEGVAALALLVVLQLVVAWGTVRWAWVGRVVKAEPSLLYHRGAFVERALRRERVTEEDVRAAARQAGHASLATVEAVVLETAGDIAVVGKAEGGERGLVEGVGANR